MICAGRVAYCRWRMVRRPRRAKCSSARPWRPASRIGWLLREEQHVAFDPGDDLGDAFAALQVGEDEWAVAAHFLRITAHHLEIGTHGRGEVDLIDDQEVGTCHAWPSLAWDFIAASDVDDVDRDIDQLRAERGGQVVATALDKHEVESGKAL